jgi:hypothetical protein
MSTEMETQEANVEKSSEFKSLGGFGKTISSVGWWMIIMGAVSFLLGFAKWYFWWGSPLMLFGFLVVISGQAISCMVAIARHTETTNNILTRHTELLEALKEKC